MAGILQKLPFTYLVIKQSLILSKSRLFASLTFALVANWTLTQMENNLWGLDQSWVGGEGLLSFFLFLLEHIYYFASGEHMYTASVIYQGIWTSEWIVFLDSVYSLFFVFVIHVVGVQNQPAQDAPEWYAGYSELKANETLRAQEKLPSPP